VPDIYALKLLNHSVREVAGLPLIFLNESPITSTRTGIFFKDVMDKVLSFLLLLILFPFLVGVAVMIRVGSKGPAFFKQQRHGWDGKVFEIWKFRTMYIHDDNDVKQATRDDQRITPIGRFLRRTSIDELPQLFNVLSGEMSLVGPRPHAVAHNDYYDDHIENYLLRHRIKPGITGLAQVNGCRGETEEINQMRERVRYDVEYINNWSLWLDIKILAKTPFSLTAKHIY
jgi:putative colanic acid biosynthesis UDP-glucose lipid carrier transferase